MELRKKETEKNKSRKSGETKICFIHPKKGLLLDHPRWVFGQMDFEGVSFGHFVRSKATLRFPEETRKKQFPTYFIKKREGREFIPSLKRWIEGSQFPTLLIPPWSNLSNASSSSSSTRRQRRDVSGGGDSFLLESLRFRHSSIACFPIFPPFLFPFISFFRWTLPPKKRQGRIHCRVSKLQKPHLVFAAEKTLTIWTPCTHGYCPEAPPLPFSLPSVLIRVFSGGGEGVGSLPIL